MSAAEPVQSLQGFRVRANHAARLTPRKRQVARRWHSGPLSLR